MDAQTIINESNFESQAVNYARQLYNQDKIKHNTLKYCRRINGIWEIAEN